jgi:hypothetical protein
MTLSITLHTFEHLIRSSTTTRTAQTALILSRGKRVYIVYTYLRESSKLLDEDIEIVKDALRRRI